jgi:tetratricopeptide (TPR) repeat protein
VRELDGRSSQGDALIVLGRVRAAVGNYAAAAEALEEALAAYQALGHRHKAAEAHGALAQLALTAGDIPQALTQVEAILPRLAEGLPVGIDEPFDVYLACYQTLAAAQDQRARAVLLAGRATLRVYAARVPPSHLEYFLENVPSHRELNIATL